MGKWQKYPGRMPYERIRNLKVPPFLMTMLVLILWFLTIYATREDNQW